MLSSYKHLSLWQKQLLSGPWCDHTYSHLVSCQCWIIILVQMPLWIDKTKEHSWFTVYLDFCYCIVLLSTDNEKQIILHKREEKVEGSKDWVTRKEFLFLIKIFLTNLNINWSKIFFNFKKKVGKNIVHFHLPFSSSSSELSETNLTWLDKTRYWRTGVPFWDLSMRRIHLYIFEDEYVKDRFWLFWGLSWSWAVV